MSGGISIGKRKRSARSMTDPPQKTVLALTRLSIRDEAQHPHSSSSLSSSESDTGIYTNDEGREGKQKKILLIYGTTSCYNNPFITI